MSGIVKIRDDVKWMASGWAYDNVLQRIADELETIDSALSDTLLAARTDVGLGYCDLRLLHNEEFYNLIQATDRAYERSLIERTKSFYLPQYYSSFMSLFEELKIFLHSDPRALLDTNKNK